MTEQEMILAIQSKIKEVYETAKVKFGREFATPSFNFHVKGKVAGWAHYQANVMRFNRKLMLENWQDFIEDTVPHECAHLIAWQLKGREGVGHGFWWKHVMVSLGVEPKRCHSYDTSPEKWKGF